MSEIKTVMLFTNRVVALFDEEGNMQSEEMALINNKRAYSTYSNENGRLLTLIKSLGNTGVTILIGEFGKWEHKIHYENFLLMLGVERLEIDALEGDVV
jgi:hypothetical protein